MLLAGEESGGSETGCSKWEVQPSTSWRSVLPYS